MAVNPSVILVVMSLFISAAAIASLIKWPPSGIASRLVYYYSVIHCLFTAVFIPLVRLLYPDTPPMSAGVAVCSILLLTGVYGVMFAIVDTTWPDWKWGIVGGMAETIYLLAITFFGAGDDVEAFLDGVKRWKDVFIGIVSPTLKSLSWVT
ncbi:hypothetical protein VKT23_003504 [Stygiomarasmius scandens]|uniref:NADH dehydrogenase subunit 6 n=1 Tax=Marasmiellus scandens TaxID=2682957 RepID=A0ABR1K1R7_9AGAR